MKTGAKVDAKFMQQADKYLKAMESGIEQQDEQAVRTAADKIANAAKKFQETMKRRARRAKTKFFISNLYTGSAADYNKADMRYVATGTGAQSYGWGLYSTETRSSGEGYANVDAKMKNVRKVAYKGNEYTQRSNFLGDLDGLQGIEKAALMEILSKGGVEEALQKTDDAEVRDFLAAQRNEFEVTQPQDIEGRRNLYRQTWFTNREGEGEANLLVWNEKVTPAQTTAILDGLARQTGNKAVVDFVNGKRQQEGLAVQDSYTSEKLRGNLEKYLDLKDVNGNSVYGQLTKLLGSMKAASEFLNRECDIDGMKYPANHKDGSKGYNYVSYSDATMRVDEHVKWSLADGKIEEDNQKKELKNSKNLQHSFSRSTSETGSTIGVQPPVGWQNAVRQNAVRPRNAVSEFFSTLFNITTLNKNTRNVISCLWKIASAANKHKRVPGLNNPLTVDNFATSLTVAGFQYKGKGSSVYNKVNGVTIRVSDHQADADTFTKDKTKNNLSIVLEKPDINKAFQADSNIFLIEAEYKIENLEQHPESLISILKDIATFAATREYHPSIPAYDYHFSGKPDQIAEARKNLAKDALSNPELNKTLKAIKQRAIDNKDWDTFNAMNQAEKDAKAEYEKEKRNNNASQVTVKNSLVRQVNPIVTNGQIHEEYQSLLDTLQTTPFNLEKLEAKARAWFDRVGDNAFDMIRNHEEPGRDLGTVIRRMAMETEEFRQLPEEERREIMTRHSMEGSDWSHEGMARQMANRVIRTPEDAKRVFGQMKEKLDEKTYQKIRQNVLKETGIDIEALPKDIVEDHNRLDHILREAIASRASIGDNLGRAGAVRGGGTGKGSRRASAGGQSRQGKCESLQSGFAAGQSSHEDWREGGCEVHGTGRRIPQGDGKWH